MKRIDIYDRIFWGLVILAIILSFIGILYDVHAQEDAVNVCRDPEDPTWFTFHIPDAWSEAELSWWSFGSDYITVDRNTVQVKALTDWGDRFNSEFFPQWQRDVEDGQAVVGSGDYSQIVTGDANTPLCVAETPEVTPLPETPTEPPGDEPQAAIEPQIVQVEVGKTCTVHYPQIVLVCNG